MMMMMMMMMSGCVIVVDAESDADLDCVAEHHAGDDDGTPRLGIGIGHVDAALAGQLNIPNADRATLVRSVEPGSPADRAGVHQFDVITKVDGSDDASLGALWSALRGKQPGEVVTLTVIRNAQPLDLAVTIAPDSDPHAATDADHDPDPDPDD